MLTREQDENNKRWLAAAKQEGLLAFVYIQMSWEERQAFAEGTMPPHEVLIWFARQVGITRDKVSLMTEDQKARCAKSMLTPEEIKMLRYGDEETP